MYQCKVCGYTINYVSEYDGKKYGFCEWCERTEEVIEIADYELDYSPETQTFSLVDRINNTVIVITKEQLEKLIEFYHRI